MLNLYIPVDAPVVSNTNSPVDEFMLALSTNPSAVNTIASLSTLSIVGVILKIEPSVVEYVASMLNPTTLLSRV